MRRFALTPVFAIFSAAVLAQGGQLPVETAKVEVRALEDSLSTVGTLRADESVVVRPEIAGRIEAIQFNDGQPVNAGAPLFSLDAALIRADFNEARAELARSRSANQRASELVERQLIARADFDNTRADLAVDEARLASAQARLDKTVIRAPFPGVVGLRQVSPGDFVAVGDALVNLVRLNPMHVDFRLPEVHLGRLAAGQSVAVAVDAYPGRTFAGTVEAVDPMIDTAGRSALVRATVGNPSGELRPGLFARVELVLTQAPRALVVPEEAIWPLGDKQHVFQVVDGKAKLVEVTTGQRLPGLVEITSGLSAGDEVVTAGQPKLRDGMPVMTLSPSDPAPGGGAPVAQR